MELEFGGGPLRLRAREMKCKTIQVLWHGKDPKKQDPVYSVDFNPSSGLLVTCGADKEIKLWEVKEDAEGNPEVKHVETLTAHTKTANVVRFSPGGDMLASGGDVGEVLVWKPGSGTNQHGDPTTWRTHAVLRGHAADVFDLAWGPGGGALVTGSLDHSSIIWDVPKSRSAYRLEGHRHYVQGVAWDPHGEYITSQSADRTVRLWASRGKPHPIASYAWCRNLTCQRILSKAEENPDPRTAAPAAPDGKGPRQFVFHDDTMPSFFRRPSWSPCGSFLAAPAGVYREHTGAAEQHATYLYQRDRFARPALRLPGIAPAVCVKFSPVLYANQGPPRGPSTPSGGTRCAGSKAVVEAERQTKEAGGKAEENATESVKAEENVDALATDAVDGGDAVMEVADAAAPAPAEEGKISLEPVETIDLPYRVIFAVCTTDTIAVYDTSQETPIAFVGGLHYASITDAAWSPDGRTLVVSSSDGYCSVMSFAEAELGRVLNPEEVPEHVRGQLPVMRVRAAAEAAKAAAEAAKAATAAAEARTAAAAVTTPGSVPGAAPAPTERVSAAAAQGTVRRLTPMAVALDAAPAVVADPSGASAAGPRRIAPQPADTGAPARRIAPQPVEAPGAATAAAAVRTSDASPGQKRSLDAAHGDAGAKGDTTAKAPKRIAPQPC